MSSSVHEHGLRRSTASRSRHAALAGSADHPLETGLRTLDGLVGSTPIVALRRLPPPGAGRVLVKLESNNPTGSMKDRMALAMIRAAVGRGDIEAAGTVVEYTGGSTGVSLAYVAAVLGLRAHIVTSDAFSIEKRRHMEALGAQVTVIASDHGKMDAALTNSMIDAAREITRSSGGFWTDQLRNGDQIDGYRRLGSEIVAQTGGRISAFVQGVGTAGSILGVSEVLRAETSAAIVAVEPAESAVLSGGASGAHFIEGMGAGFVVPLWRPDAVDDIATVTTREAMTMARRLAREEGMFAGTSTGGNVLVACRLADRLGPDATVVTVACDSGIKYLSTELYGDAASDREPVPR